MTTQDRPEAPLKLSGSHHHTFEAIFRQPTAHNLAWHDVRSLLAAVADVSEGNNGSLHVTRNGHVVTLHAPKHQDVLSVEDVLAIRRFLGESRDPATSSSVGAAIHVVVVIDHHEAKIYRTERDGSVPQRLVPYDPHGFGRHLQSENPETDGKRAPERKSYYEAIARTLRGADEILIFGSGTGESSAMDHLIADLKANHGDVAENIVGSVVISEHHLTEGQLLAKARDFFATKPS